MYRNNLYLCANFSIMFVFFGTIFVASSLYTGLLGARRFPGG
jgi:hypothetical protein